MYELRVTRVRRENMKQNNTCDNWLRRMRLDKLRFPYVHICKRYVKDQGQKVYK